MALVALALALALAACASPQPPPLPTLAPAYTPAPPGVTPLPLAGTPTVTATAKPGTPLASPTVPPQPSPTPMVRASWADFVFVWERDLWLGTADGRRQLRLTHDAAGYSSPRWSPDGTRIVFVQGEGLQAEIGLVNPDGSGKRLLTKNNAADTGPVWSPRGTAIAFTRAPDTNADGQSDLRDEAEVWLMDPDGSNQRRIANGRDPAWSPEGLRIAFATNGIATSFPPYRIGNAINLVNTLGQNEWTLVSVAKVPTEVKRGDFTLSPGTILVKHPAWRPDGSQMAFTTSGHTGLALTISLRATDLQVLDANYEGGFGRVVWSPGGDLLAYEAFPATGLNEVKIADLSGKQVGSLGGVQRGLSVVEPSWSPDGARILFAQWEAEPYLGIASADASNPKPLMWGRARWPDWAPWRP